MNKLPKYPAYKSSEVEWLGDIPEHWEVKPGFTLLYEAKVKNTGMKRTTVLSLSYGKIRIKETEELTGLVPESFETYQFVNKGDIIFRPTDLQNDHVSLRSGVSEFEGIITSAYLNLRLRPIADNKFYSYFFRGIDNNKVIYGLGSGLRQNIDFRDFKRFMFPCPPLLEQAIIASFLDRKTVQIDQAIVIKEKQIELLKERRQILIHRAVTRGLNPNAKLKDSGVEWIGEIPEHWKVKRFKHFTKILSGYSPEQVKLTEEPKIDYFKVDDLNNVDENYRLSNSNWFVENFKLAKIYSKNILLIPKRGGAIGTNKIAITTTFCVFDTNVMGLEFDLLKVDIDLIAIWLKSRNLITIADTTTIPQINNKHIYPLEIALPELSEQIEIIDYIKKSSNKFATAISLKEQEIEKLKEYKASLIDAAVTGKIKVAQHGE